jgi:RIO-like serine/threonine protein kinase
VQCSDVPSSQYRSLYPEKTRQADLLTVLAGIARWCRREGYWPKRSELQGLLRSDLAATADLIGLLIESHYIERLPRSSGYARYQITVKGFDLLGIVPIEPWRKVPTKAIIRRTVNAAAARVLRMEAAALENAQ